MNPIRTSEHRTNWLVPGVLLAYFVLATVLLVGMRWAGFDPGSLHYSSFQPSVGNVIVGLWVYAILIGTILAAQRWIAREQLSNLGIGPRWGKQFFVGLATGLAIALSAKFIGGLVDSGSQIVSVVSLSPLFLRTGSFAIIVGVHTGLNRVAWQFSGNAASGAFWGTVGITAGQFTQWINVAVIAVAVAAIWISPRRSVSTEK